MNPDSLQVSVYRLEHHFDQFHPRAYFEHPATLTAPRLQEIGDGANHLSTLAQVLCGAFKSFIPFNRHEPELSNPNNHLWVQREEVIDQL